MYKYILTIFVFILFLLNLELFYIYLSCFTCIFTTFFLFDGYQIITNTIVFQYKRWRQLNELVSYQYKNAFSIFWYSFILISKAFYLSFLQYMNNSIKKIDKNNYEISYLIDGKMYKMIVKPHKGPACILQVIDENNKDITDEIIPYLGPENDWHGRKFSSKDFKKKSLTFELGNGEERTFEEGEILNVK